MRVYPARTSPSPGRSPAAVSAKATPPVWPLEPSPSAPASNKATDLERSRVLSDAAAAKPVKPPPTTAKSTVPGRDCRVARKFTVQGRWPQFFVDVGVMGHTWGSTEHKDAANRAEDSPKVKYRNSGK